ncbi:protein kinase [Candidatus Daviesbacteria bacterium]|nr:protein kinase [Candidatus Daviesbacteria bacterium]
MERVQDHYNTLEVSPKARPEIIEAAYRTLAKIYHPDIKTGDTDTFKAIVLAHEILSDPAKRVFYDREKDKLEGKVIGDYRFLSKIAEGAFGRTYKAEHIIIREPVCIKDCSKISPQAEKILIDEAKAVWDLRHYALPAMRGLVRLENKSLGLVMSYIEGPTLEQIVAKAGNMDPEDVAWMAERSLNALKYMHYKGVIHGDIKPQNIIIQPESHMAVLIDFGLSMVKPTQNSDAKGFTPYFAPKEQITGLVILPESDLYSLGKTMIYALSGGNLDCVRDGLVPRIVPDEMCMLIRRLTREDRAERPIWENEDLCDTIADMRVKVFGRRRSNMKPVAGFS